VRDRPGLIRRMLRRVDATTRHERRQRDAGAPRRSTPLWSDVGLLVLYCSNAALPGRQERQVSAGGGHGALHPRFCHTCDSTSRCRVPGNGRRTARGRNKGRYLVRPMKSRPGREGTCGRTRSRRQEEAKSTLHPRVFRPWFSYDSSTTRERKRKKKRKRGRVRSLQMMPTIAPSTGSWLSQGNGSLTCNATRLVLSRTNRPTSPSRHASDRESRQAYQEHRGGEIGVVSGEDDNLALRRHYGRQWTNSGKRRERWKGGEYTRADPQ